MNNKRLGILALLVSVILWGMTPVVTKLALAEITPFSLAFLRAVISTSIVFILFYKKGYFKIKREDLKIFIIAGFLGSVFNLVFFLLGVKLTSAINTQTIFTINPVLTAILASALLKEKIKRVQYVGIFIGLLGALTVAAREFFETGSFNEGSMIGNLFIFFAALSWVGYILVSKKLSKKYSPITITGYSFLVSLFVFTPIAFFENYQNLNWVSHLTFNGFFGIFYQGVFASVIAFLAYQTGLKLTSAFTAGVILYLNPIVTTLVAVPVLGEKITTPFIIGAILIIVGSVTATQYEFLKNNIRRRKGG